MNTRIDVRTFLDEMFKKSAIKHIQYNNFIEYTTHNELRHSRNKSDNSTYDSRESLTLLQNMLFEIKIRENIKASIIALMVYMI